MKDIEKQKKWLDSIEHVQEEVNHAREYTQEHAGELFNLAEMYGTFLACEPVEDRISYLDDLRIAYDERGEIIEGCALLYTLVDREEFSPEDLDEPKEFLREYYCRLATPEVYGWDRLNSVHLYVPYEAESTVLQSQELMESLGMKTVVIPVERSESEEKPEEQGVGEQDD